uniref:Uncharacterized protein n=1 Tax=Anguilla anguilla TaxID=7936 RepID=A0A0E9UNV4_ANGAN
MCVEFMPGLLLETFGTECLSEIFGGSSFVRNRTENSVLQYRVFHHIWLTLYIFLINGLWQLLVCGNICNGVS